MQTKKTDFSLDASANELYAQLSGIDTTRRILDPAPQESSLLELLGAEEQWLDRNRLFLIEICWLLADILHKSRQTDPGQSGDQEKALWTAIKQLSGCPQFDGTISIRYRGSGFPGQDAVQEQCDYEVSSGNLLLDLQVAGSMAKRMAGRPGSALPGQLLAAFKGFSALGINHLHLDSKVGSEEDKASLLDSLRALSRYYREVDQPENSAAIVRDEYNLANPNLTLLATINGVKPAAVQKLVAEIAPMLFGPEAKEALASFPTVFNAIFAFPKLKAQLKKPALEVNNIQRLMPGQSGARDNRGQAMLSRMAIASYGESPQQVAEVLASVSSGGYQNIYMGTLQKRLTLASDFLNKSKNSPQPGKIQEEALHNIEAGLEMVPDALYESLDIFGSRDESASETAPLPRHDWALHQEIFSLLSFFKRRSVIKQKMRDMVRGQVRFEPQDYAVIARNFRISDSQAAHLVQLLNSCFDDHGRFRRSAFEKNIPQFVQYETKVFEFLWHYLKELVSRDDRVSFLNAMQHLIAKLANPAEALKILLSDIFNQAHRIGFSDRNGLLLANILIRTYNQELGNHIELTPEEVLQVKMGLNQEMVAQALAFFAEEQEHLFRKLRTIHEELQKTVRRESGEAGIPLHYLITLERELIIFLALIGGPASHKILHGVVKEYGNPEAGIYVALPGPEEGKGFLQLLQVAVRGLKRFSEREDLLLFTVLADREPRFLALWDNESHRALVKRVMEWVR
ncbi:hypothetical protein [Thiovibrio frasassiensis]|uniref:Uncharacterized protein n=1 Tax=Thiovibrio frasassiensis TaxID=2984131 RepID=A0A9X4MEY1_9BACT|nr:hypothetical protein [Thiovibrio frasassiensis]MDG4475046.1 hypothetical protein [Thiovibrio frasassiensis]